MSHTNSTTNYSLPQFVTTDKPAWLTDINNAFSAIDTGMHNAQTKANTADTNASQAILDAAAASSAASAADAKGAGAVASLADTFQTTETYAVGDLVIYNNLLYVCSVAVTEPGAWTGSTNWTRTTIESAVVNKTGADIKVNSDPDSPTIDGAISILSSGKADAADVEALSTDLIINNPSNVTSATLNILMKRNKTVSLDYIFTCKSLTEYKNKTWGTIPADYRPYVGFRCFGSLVPDYTAPSGTTKPLMLEINTSGEIRCPNTGAYADLPAPTANSQISIHVVYFLN